MSINTTAYLERIGYIETLKADKQTLFALHEAHLYHIPFEDLNIHYNIPIVLGLEALYKKVIQGKRGGFCYELNHLFSHLLQKIGFRTTMISVKVINKEGQPGPVFDHLALIIDLEKRWFVDVGFGGDAFVMPKELILDAVQRDIHDFYKFTKHNEKEWALMQSKDGKDYRCLYILSFEAQQIANFEAQCQIKQVDPNSHFVKNRICTKATPAGRLSLLNDQYIIRKNGQKDVIDIKDEAHFLEILERDFGITRASLSQL